MHGIAFFCILMLWMPACSGTFPMCSGTRTMIMGRDGAPLCSGTYPCVQWHTFSMFFVYTTSFFMPSWCNLSTSETTSATVCPTWCYIVQVLCVALKKYCGGGHRSFGSLCTCSYRNMEWYTPSYSILHFDVELFLLRMTTTCHYILTFRYIKKIYNRNCAVPWRQLERLIMSTLYIQYLAGPLLVHLSRLT